MTESTRDRAHGKSKPKHKRRVSSATTCVHCKGRFWAPKGEVVCPHCGKRVVVEQGIIGSPKGFFGSYLEGLAISGSISGADVSLTALGPSRRSHGLSDVCRKVISERPHQKRATEGQNRKKKFQEPAKSNTDCLEGEIE